MKLTKKERARRDEEAVKASAARMAGAFALGPTTLDEQDALMVRLVQDRDALLAACKFVVAFDERDASVYLDGNAWTNAMKQARTAIAQAEAHQ